MIKIDENYTDFRDDTDPDYPGGKAVDAPTPESVEGTPFLARWMNCLNGFRQAIFQKAFGSLEGVSGEPDNANVSDTVDAIDKLIADGDADTLAQAEGKILAAQLATNTWLPAVDTLAILQGISAPDPNKNYLCKVLDDPAPANNLVWQLVAGETAWTRFGNTPSPSNASPLMDGVASPGTDTEFSRGGHRHPTDTGRAAASHSHALGTGANQVNAAPANSNEYTFVIDSNAALAAWAANAAGNDYSRILIKAGEWTFNTALHGGTDPNQVAAIDISNGRTMSVVGEAGSRIVINSTTPAYTHIVGIRGRVTGTYPDFVSPGGDFFFENVNVLVNRSGSGRSVAFFGCSNLTNCTGSGLSSGFRNCANLTDCTGIGTGSGAGPGNFVGGFNNCSNLTNCTGIGTGTSTGGGSSGGFNNCANLTNCIGTGTAPDDGNSSVGFVGCIGLINCSGTGISTATVSGSGCGFRNCTNLTNCVGIGTGSGIGEGFDNCANLTNCAGTGSGPGSGFNNCSRLTNCTGNSPIPTLGFSGHIFNNCSNLTNCRAINMGGGNGFRGCRFLVSCFGHGENAASFSLFRMVSATAAVVRASTTASWPRALGIPRQTTGPTPRRAGGTCSRGNRKTHKPGVAGCPGACR